MRVLHLLSSTGFHGAETMAAALVRELAAAGVENHVGVFRSHDGSNSDILEVVRDVLDGAAVFPCRGKLDWRALRALRRYVRRQKIDVVHSHKYKTNFYAIAACAGLKRALISTCHNWLGTSAKMRFYAALDKRILSLFDGVVGVSEEVAGELRKYVDADKVSKIDNGIDVERFMAATSKPHAKQALGIGDRPVIGFVGRLAPDKAVSDLIRALRMLHDRGVPGELLVVGDGECAAALQETAGALGVAAQVHFLGRRDDTPAIYPAMDVFVLPSLKEAFPMVLLEAMAAGVPIVATDVGDASYILERGACGTIVAPGDVSGLSRAIERSFAEPQTARALAVTARERVRRCFSSSAMGHRYRQLYSSILKRRFGALRSVP